MGEGSGKRGRKPLGCALSRGREVGRKVVPWPAALTGGSGWGGQGGDRENACAPRLLKFHRVVKLNPLQTQALQVGFQVEQCQLQRHYSGL